MGARHDASKRREPDADRNHRRHHGRQRNAERAHHVRVLHSGAHDPAEGGLVEEQPQAGDGQHGDAENDEAVIGVDEAANQHDAR